jgi:uncharacterized protein YecT (DUF1311 family)
MKEFRILLVMVFGLLPTVRPVLASEDVDLSLVTTEEEEVNPKHPIEVAMDAAMEKDGSTAGMLRAIDAAQKSWDDLLNRHYTKLRALLGENDAETLKAAQRAWLAFRDAELEALMMIYGKMDGTMYRPMHAYAAMELVKVRALALGRRVEMLQQR